MKELNIRSIERLKGVHPDLVIVVKDAINNFNFLVIEGLRTLERQKKLYAQKKTQTLNSRHLTGHAVDLGVLDKNGKITWDFEEYKKLWKVMEQSSQKLAIPIVWGGNWTTLKDGPHFELDRKKYK